jgi:cephalosporin-C deacetylase
MRTLFSRAVALLPLFAAHAAIAQTAAPSPTRTTVLDVVPDHADWQYRLGDTARFTVTVTKSSVPVSGARVRIQLGPERRPPERVDTLTTRDGRATTQGTMRAPGFLRLVASVEVNGESLRDTATVGFSPERIVAATPMPADFRAFWQAALDSARSVPLDPVLTPLPGRSTPEVNVYHVSFQNHRVGSRLYGMLSVPAKPGKYPAMLVVPGAGVRPYFPSVATARRGVIHLAIGIHGIPVDRDSLLYNELRATALQNYRAFGVEDRDAYYYKRVFVGVVRAGDFLFGLPQHDGKGYVVQGGSQGGGLALVAGTLDPRVQAIAVSYPALADQFGYLQGRAGGWPHLLADTSRVKALREKLETIPYYDAANFARLLKVPGIYAWGFNDPTVPPTASFAAYNAVTAPKDVLLSPPNGHDRARWQIDRMEAWLLARLGVRDAGP